MNPSLDEQRQICTADACRIQALSFAMRSKELERCMKRRVRRDLSGSGITLGEVKRAKACAELIAKLPHGRLANEARRLLERVADEENPGAEKDQWPEVNVTLKTLDGLKATDPAWPEWIRKFERSGWTEHRRAAAMKYLAAFKRAWEQNDGHVAGRDELLGIAGRIRTACPKIYARLLADGVNPYECERILVPFDDRMNVLAKAVESDLEDWAIDAAQEKLRRMEEHCSDTTQDLGEYGRTLDPEREVVKKQATLRGRSKSARRKRDELKVLLDELCDPSRPADWVPGPPEHLSYVLEVPEGMGVWPFSPEQWVQWEARVRAVVSQWWAEFWTSLDGAAGWLTVQQISRLSQGLEQREQAFGAWTRLVDIRDRFAGMKTELAGPGIPEKFLGRLKAALWESKPEDLRKGEGATWERTTLFLRERTEWPEGEALGDLITQLAELASALNASRIDDEIPDSSVLEELDEHRGQPLWEGLQDLIGDRSASWDLRQRWQDACERGDFERAVVHIENERLNGIAEIGHFRDTTRLELLDQQLNNYIDDEKSDLTDDEVWKRALTLLNGAEKVATRVQDDEYGKRTRKRIEDIRSALGAVRKFRAQLDALERGGRAIETIALLSSTLSAYQCAHEVESAMRASDQEIYRAGEERLRGQIDDWSVKCKGGLNRVAPRDEEGRRKPLSKREIRQIDDELAGAQALLPKIPEELVDPVASGLEAALRHQRTIADLQDAIRRSNMAQSRQCLESLPLDLKSHPGIMLLKACVEVRAAKDDLDYKNRIAMLERYGPKLCQAEGLGARHIVLEVLDSGDFRELDRIENTMPEIETEWPFAAQDVALIRAARAGVRLIQGKSEEAHGIKRAVQDMLAALAELPRDEFGDKMVHVLSEALIRQQKFVATAMLWWQLERAGWPYEMQNGEVDPVARLQELGEQRWVNAHEWFYAESEPVDAAAVGEPWAGFQGLEQEAEKQLHAVDTARAQLQAAEALALPRVGGELYGVRSKLDDLHEKLGAARQLWKTADRVTSPGLSDELGRAFEHDPDPSGGGILRPWQEHVDRDHTHFVFKVSCEQRPRSRWEPAQQVLLDTLKTCQALPQLEVDLHRSLADPDLLHPQAQGLDQRRRTPVEVWREVEEIPPSHLKAAYLERCLAPSLKTLFDPFWREHRLQAAGEIPLGQAIGEYLQQVCEQFTELGDLLEKFASFLARVEYAGLEPKHRDLEDDYRDLDDKFKEVLQEDEFQKMMGRLDQHVGEPLSKQADEFIRGKVEFFATDLANMGPRRRFRQLWVRHRREPGVGA